MKFIEIFKKFINKFFKFILGMPIGLKISLIMILILSISIILISNILFNQEKKLLLKEIKNRGKLLSEDLAQAGFEAVIHGDKMSSIDTISKIMKGEGIVYAIIVDKAGRIVDSSLTPDDPVMDIHDVYLAVHEKQIKQINKVGFFHIDFKGKKVIDIVSPILLEYKGKKNKQGFVRIGISQDIIDNEIKKARDSAFKVAGILIVVGILVSFFFASSITIPIRKIVKVMQNVGKGDFSQSVKISLTDEIGKLADSFNTMIVQLREKLMMSKYVSKSTIKMISEAEEGKTSVLDGVRKEVTMLFSDIRGFAALSETKAPEQIVVMLNKYLSFQADIIALNEGSVDKFVGDEVVAIFEGERSVENAIKSAIQIQKKIAIWNKMSQEKVYIGIGINTGEVVMGNMGSKNRMDYTVIGDNVNIAARLCDSARQDQILVSDSTYQIVKNKFRFYYPSEISVKGKKKPVKVYAVAY